MALLEVVVSSGSIDPWTRYTGIATFLAVAAALVVGFVPLIQNLARRIAIRRALVPALRAELDEALEILGVNSAPFESGTVQDLVAITLASSGEDGFAARYFAVQPSLLELTIANIDALEPQQAASVISASSALARLVRVRGIAKASALTERTAKNYLEKAWQQAITAVRAARKSLDDRS